MNTVRANRLKELTRKASSCRLCSAMAQRSAGLGLTNGPPWSKVMFVAEVPGRLGADRTGMPLHGDQTGLAFEKLLAEAGWQRDEVFITNAVLCNPRDARGSNRRPLPGGGDHTGARKPISRRLPAY